jgi:hypothetical protein
VGDNRDNITDVMGVRCGGCEMSLLRRALPLLHVLSLSKDGGGEGWGEEVLLRRSF